MVTSCPDCRSHSVRRRKRTGFSLYFLSLLGKWPYRCEECGSNFLLRKRYVRRKTDRDPQADPGVRESSRVKLTAPIGGVAGGDEVNIKTRSVARDLGSLRS